MQLTYRFLLAWFCLFLFFIQCKSSKYTPENPSSEYISFGSGGGVTGAVTEYLLCDNGQLFMKSTLAESWEQLEKVPSKATTSLFERTHQINWETTDLNEPGNYYYYIHFKNEKSDKTLTWGSAKAPEQIQLLFTELNNIIRLKAQN